ncbi:MAG: hypothetical protein WCP53_15490 [Verrucomicrobiota bacterium]
MLMKIEWKAATILLLTLLLGTALGAVVRTSWATRRADAIGGMRRPGGFVAHMQQVIEPRDSAQARAILPALQHTAERNDAIIREARGQLKSELDSMRVLLAPLLDESQRSRLDEISRMEDPFGPPGGRGRGRGGPGRGGRGGRGGFGGRGDGGPPFDGPPPDGPPANGGRRGPPPAGPDRDF